MGRVAEFQTRVALEKNELKVSVNYLGDKDPPMEAYLAAFMRALQDLAAQKSIDLESITQILLRSPQVLPPGQMGGGNQA